MSDEYFDAEEPEEQTNEDYGYDEFEDDEAYDPPDKFTSSHSDEKAAVSPTIQQNNLSPSQSAHNHTHNSHYYFNNDDDDEDDAEVYVQTKETESDPEIATKNDYSTSPDLPITAAKQISQPASNQTSQHNSNDNLNSYQPENHGEEHETALQNENDGEQEYFGDEYEDDMEYDAATEHFTPSNATDNNDMEKSHQRDDANDENNVEIDNNQNSGYNDQELTPQTSLPNLPEQSQTQLKYRESHNEQEDVADADADADGEYGEEEGFEEYYEESFEDAAVSAKITTINNKDMTDSQSSAAVASNDQPPQQAQQQAQQSQPHTTSSTPFDYDLYGDPSDTDLNIDVAATNNAKNSTDADKHTTNGARNTSDSNIISNNSSNIIENDIAIGGSHRNINNNHTYNYEAVYDEDVNGNQDEYDDNNDYITELLAKNNEILNNSDVKSPTKSTTGTNNSNKPLSSAQNTQNAQNMLHQTDTLSNNNSDSDIIAPHFSVIDDLHAQAIYTNSSVNSPLLTGSSKKQYIPTTSILVPKEDKNAIKVAQKLFTEYTIVNNNISVVSPTAKTASFGATTEDTNPVQAPDANRLSKLKDKVKRQRADSLNNNKEVTAAAEVVDNTINSNAATTNNVENDHKMPLSTTATTITATTSTVNGSKNSNNVSNFYKNVDETSTSKNKNKVRKIIEDTFSDDELMAIVNGTAGKTNTDKTEDNDTFSSNSSYKTNSNISAARQPRMSVLSSLVNSTGNNNNKPINNSYNNKQSNNAVPAIANNRQSVRQPRMSVLSSLVNSTGNNNNNSNNNKKFVPTLPPTNVTKNGAMVVSNSNNNSNNNIVPAATDINSGNNNVSGGVNSTVNTGITATVPIKTNRVSESFIAHNHNIPLRAQLNNNNMQQQNTTNNKRGGVLNNLPMGTANDPNGLQKIPNKPLSNKPTSNAPPARQTVYKHNKHANINIQQNINLKQPVQPHNSTNSNNNNSAVNHRRLAVDQHNTNIHNDIHNIVSLNNINTGNNNININNSSDNNTSGSNIPVLSINTSPTNRTTASITNNNIIDTSNIGNEGLVTPPTQQQIMSKQLGAAVTFVDNIETSRSVPTKSTIAPSVNNNSNNNAAYSSGAYSGGKQPRVSVLNNSNNIGNNNGNKIQHTIQQSVQQQQQQFEQQPHYTEPIVPALFTAHAIDTDVSASSHSDKSADPHQQLILATQQHIQQHIASVTPQPTQPIKARSSMVVSSVRQSVYVNKYRNISGTMHTQPVKHSTHSNAAGHNTNALHSVNAADVAQQLDNNSIHSGDSNVFHNKNHNNNSNSSLSTINTMETQATTIPNKNNKAVTDTFFTSSIDEYLEDEIEEDTVEGNLENAAVSDNNLDKNLNESVEDNTVEEYLEDEAAVDNYLEESYESMEERQHTQQTQQTQQTLPQQTQQSNVYKPLQHTPPRQNNVPDNSLSHHQQQSQLQPTQPSQPQYLQDYHNNQSNHNKHAIQSNIQNNNNSNSNNKQQHHIPQNNHYFHQQWTKEPDHIYDYSTGLFSTYEDDVLRESRIEQQRVNQRERKRIKELEIAQSKYSYMKRNQELQIEQFNRRMRQLKHHPNREERMAMLRYQHIEAQQTMQTELNDLRAKMEYLTNVAINIKDFKATPPAAPRPYQPPAHLQPYRRVVKKQAVPTVRYFEQITEDNRTIQSGGSGSQNPHQNQQQPAPRSSQQQHHTQQSQQHSQQQHHHEQQQSDNVQMSNGLTSQDTSPAKYNPSTKPPVPHFKHKEVSPTIATAVVASYSNVSEITVVTANTTTSVAADSVHSGGHSDGHSVNSVDGGTQTTDEIGKSHKTHHKHHSRSHKHHSSKQHSHHSNSSSQHKHDTSHHSSSKHHHSSKHHSPHKHKSHSHSHSNKHKSTTSNHTNDNNTNTISTDTDNEYPSEPSIVAVRINEYGDTIDTLENDQINHNSSNIAPIVDFYTADGEDGEEQGVEGVGIIAAVKETTIEDILFGSSKLLGEDGDDSGTLGTIEDHFNSYQNDLFSSNNSSNTLLSNNNSVDGDGKHKLLFIVGLSDNKNNGNKQKVGFADSYSTTINTTNNNINNSSSGSGDGNNDSNSGHNSSSVKTPKSSYSTNSELYFSDENQENAENEGNYTYNNSNNSGTNSNNLSQIASQVSSFVSGIGFENTDLSEPVDTPAKVNTVNDIYNTDYSEHAANLNTTIHSIQSNIAVDSAVLAKQQAQHVRRNSYSNHNSVTNSNDVTKAHVGFRIENTVNHNNNNKIKRKSTPVHRQLSGINDEEWSDNENYTDNTDRNEQNVDYNREESGGRVENEVYTKRKSTPVHRAKPGNSTFSDDEAEEEDRSDDINYTQQFQQQAQQQNDRELSGENTPHVNILHAAQHISTTIQSNKQHSDNNNHNNNSSILKSSNKFDDTTNSLEYSAEFDEFFQDDDEQNDENNVMFIDSNNNSDNNNNVLFNGANNNDNDGGLGNMEWEENPTAFVDADIHDLGELTEEDTRIPDREMSGNLVGTQDSVYSYNHSGGNSGNNSQVNSQANFAVNGALLTPFKINNKSNNNNNSNGNDSNNGNKQSKSARFTNNADDNIDTNIHNHISNTKHTSPTITTVPDPEYAEDTYENDWGDDDIEEQTVEPESSVGVLDPVATEAATETPDDWQSEVTYHANNTMAGIASAENLTIAPLTEKATATAVVAAVAEVTAVRDIAEEDNYEEEFYEDEFEDE